MLSARGARLWARVTAWWPRPAAPPAPDRTANPRPVRGLYHTQARWAGKDYETK